MRDALDVYPPAPREVPPDLTTPSARYPKNSARCLKILIRFCVSRAAV